MLEPYVWWNPESSFVRFDADVVAQSAASPIASSRGLPPGTSFPRFRPTSEACLPGYATASEPGTVVVTASAGATADIALGAVVRRR